ncbi:MAG: DNA primase [Candidatus Omnitrophica bacterium]|nr:DNA primase [Candidatus Omnitrophota bacterium]
MAKGFISSSQLDNITAKLDIAEVISEYVALKKSGKNFKALCPFHEEKTPSFVVNPEKQIFHCFGCGIGGNAIKFLMLVENISFPQAAALAAKKAGISIDISGYRPEDEEKQEKLIKANEFASQCYQEALFSQQGKRAAEYLSGRNLTEKEISRFSIGFAPNMRDCLLKKISEEKLDKDSFIKAGLINGEGTSDVFRNRIMFPIFDFRGKITGFGGRALDDEHMPKYLNTGENAVFSKGKLLYGLNWAKQAVKEKDFVFIVEGYFDVIRMHINGIENCVAPMGTSLTDMHLRFLKRFTEKILLVFDSDEAGIRASLRNLESVVSKGFETKISMLPAGFDPDRFIDEYGIDAFRKMMEKSVDFLDFVLSIESQRHDINTPKGKSSVAREIMRIISAIPDEIEKTEYIKILSKKLGLKESVIENYLHYTAQEPGSSIKPENKISSPDTYAESLLLEILLSGGEYWTPFLEWNGYLSRRMEIVARTSKELLMNNIDITPANLISNVDEDTGRWISGTSLKETVRENGRKQQIFQDCLKKIHKSCISRQVDEIKKTINEKKDTGIPYNDEVEKIQGLLFELKKE